MFDVLVRYAHGMTEHLSASDTSIAFVLGMLVGGSQRPERAGAVSALITELRDRGVYDSMLAGLEPSFARRLAVLESVDRGQAWNQGRRP